MRKQYRVGDEPAPPPEFIQNAYAVVALWEAYEHQRDEIARLREVEQQYNELLADSVTRGMEDCSNWVRLLMSRAVVVAERGAP
jgi:hypothetical protein